ncbi:MAG: DUF1553 domain-containing protein [Planctomycetaceae bacterium]
MSCRTRSFILICCLTVLATGRSFGAEPLQFNRDILPILSDHCFACHGFDSKARQANLRLDTQEGATRPADSGMQAIVPGEPEHSELIRRLLTDDPDLQMPPQEGGKPVSAEQKSLLSRWITEGATYQKHWSFEPPAQVDPPQIPQVRHPIDRFVQARLNQVSLNPSPIAAPETLLRRVSLDLIGLPPSIDELNEFLRASADDQEAAYLDVVERLLSSPHYGERWGRWWLDQARYADSNGYSIDAPREIWPYRDWVIQSLNADLPFNEFTIQQLAGDLLPESTESQKIATGFHRNTQINQEGGIDREQFRIDSVFDRVATTGTVWLGLTVGCCQCHDHKFDPIEQKEFYRLFAFFNNQDEPNLKVHQPGTDLAEVRAAQKTAQQQLAEFMQQHLAKLTAWENRLTSAEKNKLSKDAQRALETAPEKRSLAQQQELFAVEVGKISSEFQTLQQQLTELTNQVNGIATTMVLQERAQPRQTTVFIKGDFTRPADPVTPGTPAILHPLVTTSESPTRLDLARWLVDDANPLTGRVIVNRIWQQYFGRGIVETENDFGTLGTQPSHPDLLDWLAVEFRSNGWSLKDLHRLIVTSHTYRQSSGERDDVRRIDPRNLLLARQQRLRLDAEIVRDVALKASGLLSEKMGGPPVFPPIPDGVMGQGQVRRSWKASTGPDRYRRGLYTFVYRATPPPSLSVFDAPDGFSSCTRRSRSNTPLQALTLLNDAAFFEFAQALQKVIAEDGLETAFRRCTGRTPDADELALLGKLEGLSAARVLLNLDETVTRE